MSALLTEAVDRAVTAALAEQNGAVERLIRAALDRQLSELVAAELEVRAVAVDPSAEGSAEAREAARIQTAQPVA